MALKKGALWSRIFSNVQLSRTVLSSVVLSGAIFSSSAFAEPVWIDVRTAQEKSINGIADDLRIDYTEVLPAISSLYPNKDTDLRLYCRTGRRAGIARMMLLKAGYNTVANVGSIENAKKLRKM